MGIKSSYLEEGFMTGLQKNEWWTLIKVTWLPLLIVIGSVWGVASRSGGPDAMKMLGGMVMGAFLMGLVVSGLRDEGEL